ncbi:AAA family ATPase [Leptospira yasudae]|uniref:AAA family ATPase n=1 Tax=Leptospira yasudae TaxID=2202201 RepID=UPI0013146782|nr:AAA family ATPase [Leptospira yasudae]
MPEKAVCPCIVLLYDNWNDFRFNTLYLASIFDEHGHPILKASIKIGRREGYENDFDIDLDQLPSDYFSLWQDIDTYKIISNSHLKHEILSSLNDICYDKNVRTTTKNLYVVNNSLKRDSEANKAYNEGFRLLLNIQRDQKYRFKYLGSSDGPKYPTIVFDLDQGSYGLKRICAIIGKNGVGKTTLLSNLALALSGYRNIETNVKKRPSFSKVIAISFSIFDNFYIPKSEERTFSYSYFGVRERDDKLLSQESMSISFLDAYHRMLEAGLFSHWEKSIEILFGNEELKTFDNRFEIGIEEAFDKLSSGQKFMVYTFTQVLSIIKENSILLFDEPETHLHPNGQSSMLACLQFILDEFSSFAIIATHSPVFLQGVLRENTIFLSKINDDRIVNSLINESFGQNFSVLTEEIFGFNEGNHYFAERIKSLINTYGKRDKVLIKLLRGLNSDGVSYILEALL